MLQSRHAKDRLFFLLYAVLLLFALLWARFDYVQRHVGAAGWALQIVLLGSLAYLALRSLVVLRLTVPRHTPWLWLALDLVVVTLIVRLSGGSQSEAALAYIIPVVTGAVELRPDRVLTAGGAGGALYLLACSDSLGVGEDLEQLGTRLLFLGVVTTLATWYAQTERRRVAEMTQLREQLVLADYRQALSQELHDGVQHYLVAASARLDLARKLGEGNPSQGLEMAAGVRHTVRQAADELRYLVRRLRSPQLERHGFVGALREHLELYDSHVPFAIEFAVRAEQVDLPPDVEQAALRIVQEALTNAEKHAQPTRVKVDLSLTPAALEMTVEDDGAGFETSALPEEPAPGEGLGLAGMRQRAAAVGGTLELEGRPGRGCRLRFRVPLT